MTDGVIYIAFGERYVREALYSAGTLKAHCNLPVTLFTDRTVSSLAIDEIVIIDPRHKRAKVDVMSRTPYDRTLYLDSDTQVVRDLTDLFGILDRFDVAAAQDHSRKRSAWANVFPEYQAIPYAFSEFNSGVLLFRSCERVTRLFELWQTYFYRYFDVTGGQDQASFRVALWTSEAAIHTLPFEYNVRNQQIRNIMAVRSRQPEDAGLLDARIFHWHGVGQSTWLQRFRPKYRPMRY